MRVCAKQREEEKEEVTTERWRVQEEASFSEMVISS